MLGYVDSAKEKVLRSIRRKAQIEKWTGRAAVLIATGAILTLTHCGLELANEKAELLKRSHLGQ